MYVPGNRVSMLLADQVVDPELKTLATNIPFRVISLQISCESIQARAPTNADKYSRAYNGFHNWPSRKRVETTKRDHFIQKSVRCCRHYTSWAPCS